MSNPLEARSLIIDQTVNYDFIQKEDPRATLPKPDGEGKITQRLHFDAEQRLVDISNHPKKT